MNLAMFRKSYEGLTHKKKDITFTRLFQKGKEEES
jgi:hypothetical protein